MCVLESVLSLEPGKEILVYGTLKIMFLSEIFGLTVNSRSCFWEGNIKSHGDEVG